MTKTVLASTITAVTLAAASAAFADPIRIIQNGSGVAGLSYALENGVEDFASDPDAVGGPNSIRLSTRVGGTSTDAAAALVSDFSNPSRLSATGSTSVSYATELGEGEGHVSSSSFVFFELDRPQQFLFDGDLQTSGDAFGHRSSFTGANGGLAVRDGLDRQHEANPGRARHRQHAAYS